MIGITLAAMLQITALNGASQRTCEFPYGNENCVVIVQTQRTIGLITVMTVGGRTSEEFVYGGAMRNGVLVVDNLTSSGVNRKATGTCTYTGSTLRCRTETVNGPRSLTVRY